jgi:hypothetical protein
MRCRAKWLSSKHAASLPHVDLAVFEAEDFGAEFTPELREREQRIREQAAARQK